MMKFGVCGVTLITLSMLLANSNFRWAGSFAQHRQPSACFEFLAKQNLRGNLYNAYNFGNYLIFRFDGKLPVFIDPRSSQLYPDYFLRDFIAAYRDEGLFETLVDRHDIGFTMLAKESPLSRHLISYLNQSSKWQLLYQDEHCMVHRRTFL